MKLLADIKPEAKQLIKLLRFDPNHPASKEALKTYYAATVRKASYPNLLTEDLPSVAVKAFLVTYDYNLRQTQQYLGRFARSLCSNLRGLQVHGHPKWKEVELALPDLPEGWAYYPPTAREIRACTGQGAPRIPQGCSTQELLLGLCSKPS